MKTALLHFADGRTATQDVAIPFPQTIELDRGDVSLIKRTFEYRIEQPEDAGFVDYDEVVTAPEPVIP